VEKMCEILDVSRSGYYCWKIRPICERRQKDKRILEIIIATHKRHDKWGLDAIWAEVKEQIPCSRGRVYKLMKQEGIKSHRKEKWKQTTNSRHDLPIAPNLLLRERTAEERINPKTGKKRAKYKQIFDIKTLNTVWVGDITYNWTDEGWLYTAMVKDLCTKEVVGYAMGERIDKTLVIKAMGMAIKREKPSLGLIFHSDRGSQYCSNDYQSLLKKNNITPSMSRKGNPYDNAVAENFFSNLKCECTNFHHFKTRDQAKQVIFEYIEIYYNRQRRHSGCGWITPAKYKQLILAKAAYSCLLRA
jgi:putative transposase